MSPNTDQEKARRVRSRNLAEDIRAAEMDVMRAADKILVTQNALKLAEKRLKKLKAAQDRIGPEVHDHEFILHHGDKKTHPVEYTDATPPKTWKVGDVVFKLKKMRDQPYGRSKAPRYEYHEVVKGA